MKKIFILAVLSLIGFSCTNDFEKININPAAPVDVQPEFLFRKVLFDYADNMSYEGFVAGNLLGQQFTAVDFNLFDRHSLTEPQYGGNPWPFLYENLRDNEIILSKSRENKAFAVFEGPALIYKAMLTANLTDLYGDVPYSEAFKGKEGIVSPKYDSQKDIYLGKNGIIENLDLGIAQMKSYKGAIKLTGDIIYNGDLNSWIRLANSLKIKYLMRISSKENVSVELQRIFSEGNYIIDNKQNAIYAFTASQPNNFRMSTARIGDFNLFIMSKTIEEVLSNYKDPRSAVFFRPTGNNSSKFQGLLNGPDASKLSISVGDYSFSGRVFREDAGKMRANFLTSYEVNFLISEAIQKGYVSGNAKDFYEKGVKQAFDYWYSELPSTYFDNVNTAFSSDKNKSIEQIITQKWLANITNGYEGWTEYRRTGFPKLKKIAASLNQGLIPIRMPYPASENALNSANYKIAAQTVNNNSVNVPVWWAKP